MHECSAVLGWRAWLWERAARFDSTSRLFVSRRSNRTQACGKGRRRQQQQGQQQQQPQQHVRPSMSILNFTSLLSWLSLLSLLRWDQPTKQRTPAESQRQSIKLRDYIPYVRMDSGLDDSSSAARLRLAVPKSGWGGRR